MKKWYEELFDNSAKNYDKQRFTKGTLGECDFIENELNHNKILKIIDVGCGTGRHSIELTKRGYDIVGIDLSESQIIEAKKKAALEKLNVEFIVGDARQLPFKNKFDVAIMLCEGGFPLMETDEENFKILKSISSALNENGKLIFTTLNGLYPIFNPKTVFGKQNSQLGEKRFDLLTFRESSSMVLEDDSGNEKTIIYNQRFYIPSEINWLLKSLGFVRIEFFGATLGQFSRKDKLQPDNFEMLVIANKR